MLEEILERGVGGSQPQHNVVAKSNNRGGVVECKNRDGASSITGMGHDLAGELMGIMEKVQQENFCGKVKINRCIY